MFFKISLEISTFVNKKCIFIENKYYKKGRANKKPIIIIENRRNKHSKSKTKQYLIINNSQTSINRPN